MRQVPNKSQYLIVGSGRIARHWSHYLDLLQTPYSTWNRREGSTADLIQKLKSHSKVFLCIKDDQIQNFFESFKGYGETFIHFSGTLEVQGVFGFHPLMSFGHELYDLKTYKSIHFVGTSDQEIFKNLLPEFSNAYSVISVEQKALYHGLCVLGGNGVTLLWDLVQKEFQKMGLPEQASHPYLKQVTENILKSHKGRWTGPWYRKDQETIEKNRLALSKGPLQGLYSEFQELAQQSGQQYEKH